MNNTTGKDVTLISTDLLCVASLNGLPDLIYGALQIYCYYYYQEIILTYNVIITGFRFQNTGRFCYKLFVVILKLLDHNFQKSKTNDC